MPIYAYKCSSCGHARDVLQKMSDPLLTVCPECGAATLVKQVTAAGFQLKGSGWYATDFRGGSAPTPSEGTHTDKPAAASADAGSAAPAAAAAAAASTSPAAPAPAASTSAAKAD